MDFERMEFLNRLYDFYCEHLFKNDMNTYKYLSDKEGGIAYLQDLFMNRPEQVWDYLSIRHRDAIDNGFDDGGAEELKNSMSMLFTSDDLYNYANDNRIASLVFKNEVEAYQRFNQNDTQNMKNIKMVVNFNVKENVSDLSLMNKVSQLLSQNKEKLNADFQHISFSLTNNDVYDMSKINTISDAIRYRESIVNSYVQKDSILDRFNKFVDRNTSPYINYIKSTFDNIKNDTIKQTKNIGYMFSELFENPKFALMNFIDNEKARMSQKEENSQYNKNAFAWDKAVAKADNSANKSAKMMYDNISKNVVDVVEFPNDANGRFIYNLLLNEVNHQNEGFKDKGMINFYVDKVPFAVNGQVNTIEELGDINSSQNLRIEISHNDFNKVYDKIFKQFDDSNTTLNNIKMSLLDTNVNNSKLINESVKIVDMNGMGTQKVAMVNTEVEKNLTKKNRPMTSGRSM